MRTKRKNWTTITVLEYSEIGKAYKLRTSHGNIMVSKVWVNHISQKGEVISVRFNDYWIDTLKTKIKALGLDPYEVLK